MSQPISKNGRTSDGKFARGNPGGTGNPFARRVAELREAFLDAVSADDLNAIARTLAQRAKEGDVAAGKLLLAYVLGKPTAAVNPDDVDWDEVQRRLRCPLGGDAMSDMMRRYRPEVLVAFDRFLAYAQREEFIERFAAPPGQKPKRSQKDAGNWPWMHFSPSAAPSANGFNGKGRSGIGGEMPKPPKDAADAFLCGSRR
jgi:hypothetical protein